MSVKSWLRKWLEIPPPAPPLERQVDRAFGKIGGISRDQAQMESDLRNAALWVRGTVRAMVYGTVTRAWAKQHHRAWYRQVTGKS